MLVTDLDVKGHKVLIRVDFNVPLDKSGKITDDSRIEAALPTINYVLEQGGIPVLMSHLGRPDGKKVPEMSLAPCARALSRMLGKPVIMAPDCIGEKTKDLVKKADQVVLLENLRFYDAEEHPKNDPTFAEQLASMGDFYVNDAFGTAHRAHSSTVTITHYFPERAAMGFLVQKELLFLRDYLLTPKRPFIALIGGAKISTKLGVLNALRDKVDTLLIGGGMAYTFYKALGYSIGNSIYEEKLIDQAKEILHSYKQAGVRLILPLDNVITKDGETRIVKTEEGIPDGFKGVDIGPLTITEYENQLKVAKTVLWNGPVGVFEDPNFAKGTNKMAEVIGDLNATTIVGGGDSVAAIHAANMTHKITHLSTGGGATLEFLEYGTLPGIEALSDQ